MNDLLASGLNLTPKQNDIFHDFQSTASAVALMLPLFLPAMASTKQMGPAYVIVMV